MENPSAFHENPFLILGLSEPNFVLDLDVLDQVYRQAQRKAHPDFFLSRSQVMMEAAQKHSVLLNQAYQGLKNPLIRGEWLLRMNGFWPVVERDDLFEEIMDLNADPEKAVQAANESYQKLAHAFETRDWAQAAHEYGKFVYLAIYYAPSNPRA